MELNIDLFTMVNLYVINHFVLCEILDRDVKEDHGDAKTIYREGLLFQQLIFKTLNMCMLYLTNYVFRF